MPKKLDDCVQSVMADGKSKDSAYAICVASTGLHPSDGKKGTKKSLGLVFKAQKGVHTSANFVGYDKNNKPRYKSPSQHPAVRKMRGFIGGLLDAGFTMPKGGENQMTPPALHMDLKDGGWLSAHVLMQNGKPYITVEHVKAEKVDGMHKTETIYNPGSGSGFFYHSQHLIDHLKASGLMGDTTAGLKAKKSLLAFGKGALAQIQRLLTPVAKAAGQNIGKNTEKTEWTGKIVTDKLGKLKGVYRRKHKPNIPNSAFAYKDHYKPGELDSNNHMASQNAQLGHLAAVLGDGAIAEAMRRLGGVAAEEKTIMQVLAIGHHTRAKDIAYTKEHMKEAFKSLDKPGVAIALKGFTGKLTEVLKEMKAGKKFEAPEVHEDVEDFLHDPHAQLGQGQEIYHNGDKYVVMAKDKVEGGAKWAVEPGYWYAEYAGEGSKPNIKIGMGTHNVTEYHGTLNGTVTETPEQSEEDYYQQLQDEDVSGYIPGVGTVSNGEVIEYDDDAADAPAGGGEKPPKIKKTEAGGWKYFFEGEGNSKWQSTGNPKAVDGGHLREFKSDTSSAKLYVYTTHSGKDYLLAKTGSDGYKNLGLAEDALEDKIKAVSEGTKSKHMAGIGDKIHHAGQIHTILDKGHLQGHQHAPVATHTVTDDGKHHVWTETTKYDNMSEGNYTHLDEHLTEGTAEEAADLMGTKAHIIAGTKFTAVVAGKPVKLEIVETRELPGSVGQKIVTARPVGSKTGVRYSGITNDAGGVDVWDKTKEKYHGKVVVNLTKPDVHDYEAKQAKQAKIKSLIPYLAPGVKFHYGRFGEDEAEFTITHRIGAGMIPGEKNTIIYAKRKGEKNSKRFYITPQGEVITSHKKHDDTRHLVKSLVLVFGKGTRLIKAAPAKYERKWYEGGRWHYLYPGGTTRGGHKVHEEHEAYASADSDEIHPDFKHMPANAHAEANSYLTERAREAESASEHAWISEGGASAKNGTPKYDKLQAEAAKFRRGASFHYKQAKLKRAAAKAAKAT